MKKKNKLKLSLADKKADKLLIAVGEYVNSHGGNAIVAGGIGIIHESDFKFKLVISVTGSPPKKEIKK